MKTEGQRKTCRADNGTQSLDRGLAILGLLKARAPAGMWVSEIAQDLRLNRTTVQRMMVALEANDWVVKKADGKRYFKFDEKIPQPVGSASSVVSVGGIGVPQAVLVTMQRLANEFGDAVFLVYREGNDSVGLHREIGFHPVQIMGTYPGKRHPLGVGAPSMALLAALDDATAHAVVQANMKRLEDYPGITADLIWRLRENARSRGYVVMKNYAVYRTTGVAKWFRIDGFESVFAMGVGGVSERMPVSKQGLIVKVMQEELERIPAVDLMQL